MAKCEICRSDLVLIDSDWAVAGRECPRCGQFRIDTTSGNIRADQEWFSEAEVEKMVRLSGWVREQNRAGVVPTLTGEIVNRVIARSRPDLRSRSMILLKILVLEVEGATSDRLLYDFIAQKPEILGASYSHTTEEVRLLLRILDSEGYVTDVNMKWKKEHLRRTPQINVELRSLFEHPSKEQKVLLRKLLPNCIRTEWDS
jgi:hypothetical protein